MGAVQTLKRSQFIVDLARARHGLSADVHVLLWSLQRSQKIQDYMNTHAVRKLQIGTSNNPLDGWLNTDVVPNRSPILYLDAARPFPLPDGSFDFVMSEHMIEHIPYPTAVSMIAECHRVLKPGGWIRVTTPDLSVVLGLHSDDSSEAAARYIEWAAARFFPEIEACQAVFIINNFFRAWGHQFIYDRETLSHLLSSAGFLDIRFCRPGQSDHSELQHLEGHGRELQSEEINEFESMVAEACKA